MTSPRLLAGPLALTVKIERKEFDRVLLYSNFELTVEPGQTLVVLGPSGSGKTTLLRMISGLDREFTGEIKFGTADLLGVPPGYVFQDVRLLPWMSVSRNIQFAGTRGAVGKDVVVDLLHLVGLDKSVGTLYPLQLSGGMAKRVALARALAGNPRLLLLDEPFSELDAKSKFAMYESLLRYKSLRDSPLTIILVTHDIDEAVYLSDRVLVLGEGRPAVILRELDVNLSRPRQRTHPAYIELCTKLLREMVYDVDREIQKGHIADAQQKG